MYCGSDVFLRFYITSKEYAIIKMFLIKKYIIKI